jgi:serine/threonine protein kinase/Tol biopolymer transport system component
MIGKNISRYRIIEKLGAGGMGEVFLADDPSLGRKVALKFLSRELQEDPLAHKRLLREAKAAAALDHPNICNIHEVVEAEGQSFIVMEYVEGQSLRDRILAGPIPISDALQFASETAEALESAHEKGIIHRDLKPANLMWTRHGHAKVMDFGLAKRVMPEAGDQSREETITAMTRSGTAVGTLAYMAPEQLRGQQADRRSDIFSLGIILYEMLTGSHPFLKASPMDTASAILSESAPSLSIRMVGAPLLLQYVIRKMLAKDPGRRYQSVHEVKTDLAEILAQAGKAETGTGAILPGAAETGKKSLPSQRFWIYASILLVCSVAASALITRWITRESSAPASGLVQSVIPLQPGYLLSGQNDERQGPTRTAMALSPDGRSVIYCAMPANTESGAGSQLYLRSLDRLEARPIAGTEGGAFPFISPDGNWVGFYADGKLMKVPIAGGMPVPLCAIPNFFGASWGKNDRIVLSSNHNVGLSVVSAEGGNLQTLTAPNAGNNEYSHRLPSWLPDDRGVLFTIVRQMHDMQPKTAVLAQNSREWRVILEDAADARYAPGGYLVFARRGALMAVRFDLEKLDVIGQPAPVVPDVMQSLNVGFSMQHTAASQYCFSDTGSLIYAPGGIVKDPVCSLVWVDQEGRSRDILPEKKAFFDPRLSPDGGQIVYQTLGEQKCIWTFDLSRRIPKRLTTEGVASLPIWAPDGNHVIFGWTASGARNLYEQAVDGSEPMKRMVTAAYDQFPGSWSPDGETLALVEEKEDDADILFYRPKDRKTVPFLNTRFKERQPDFSPKGRWLAYASSDESGSFDVYLSPVDNPAVKIPVSNAGGTEPLWSRDGRKLYYRRNGEVWVVDVRWEPNLLLGRPQRLFDNPYYLHAVNIRGYDISMDGREFLMVQGAPPIPDPATEIILVQNWLDKLKRLFHDKK